MKIEQRKQFLEQKRNVASRQVKESLIRKRFFDLYFNKFKESKLLAYCPKFPEIDHGNVELLKRLGSIGFPKSYSDSLSMRFFEVTNPAQLKPGEYGILEPEEKNEITNFKKYVILVPNICCDEKFGRLGMGKGYYDRFLAGLDNIKIGLCFDELLIERLCTEPLDIKLDIIITESKIYNNSRATP